MLKVSRILQDYADAGSVASLLALGGFVDDDGTFLTKAGHAGLVFRVAGVDSEGLTQAQRATLVHRFEAALRLLDERCRVYQYVLKRTIDPLPSATCSKRVAQEAIHARAIHLNTRRDTLFAVRLYLVIVYEGTAKPRTSTRLQHVWRTPREAIASWLTVREALRVLDADLTRSITTLHHLANALRVQLSEVGLDPLDKADTFRFFRALVNYDNGSRHASQLAYDTHLDFFVCDSPVECHRDHLLVGSQAVTLLTMKEPPAHTFAHLLGQLHGVPGEFVACLEWQRIASDRMRRELQTRRRHFFNKRISLVNYLSREAAPDEMLVDDSATATVRQLGEALTELEVNGHFFGQCSLTLALHGQDVDALAHRSAELQKLLAVYDGAFFEETYNALNAWVAMVPGNGAYNLRRLALLETNVADLSFLFTVDEGDRVSPHLGCEALVVFETPHHSTYAFNLHVRDVGHTLVLGATGSGKSFLLNFLTTHAQKYEPLTVILDLGHSYRKLATLLQGRYLEVGLGTRDVTINPFAFEPTPEHLHFLRAFVRVLLEGSEDGYRLSDLEDREVYDAIQNVYVLDPSQRRLFTVANLLPRAVGARLHKWIEGGRYAGLFDHVSDTLSVDRFQVFDFEAARAYPAVLEPLLFYLLHRVTERIRDPADAATLKVCVLDEAWRFIQHPTLRDYVVEGLKTWRKHNAAMLLSTQTIEDFASRDLLRTVIESCPTKLLLANPALDRQQYGDLFQLNETELDLLADLVPRQDLLLKRPDVTKVLRLTVDPRSYWMYTNTPLDNERLAAAIQTHGLEAGVSQLAASI